MKVLFWNIGADLTEKKKELLSRVINSESPDIVCLAEGTHSVDNCKDIVSLFRKNKYVCYYSPLFCERKSLKLGYDFIRYGLKVFHKKNITPKTAFKFGDQREGGRAIVFKTFLNYIEYTFVFLHNLSQVNGPTTESGALIRTISDMLTLGKVSKKTPITIDPAKESRLIIMGDFNMEPWDKFLKSKRYLFTSFLNKSNALQNRNKNIKGHFFNPILEKIVGSDSDNLIGTFYNEAFGWAMFDFVLYDSNRIKLDFDILTKLSDGYKLLKDDLTIKKAFLHEGIDHLPITISIN